MALHNVVGQLSSARGEVAYQPFRFPPAPPLRRDRSVTVGTHGDTGRRPLIVEGTAHIVTAKSIQVEVVLNALVAGTGALLLATWFSVVPTGALVAGIAYALSGFFVAHSSHVGMVQTAALLPWLLLAFLQTTATRNAFAWTAVAGLVGGSLILVGHFQSALYSMSALGVVAAVMIAKTPSRWRRGAAVAGAAAALSLLVSAVSTLPGLELASRSVRAGMDFRAATAGALEPQTLLTLFQPNHYGALSGTYHGPGDITQAYLYTGLLAIPLAVLGCLYRREWHVAAALTLVAFWYALGPAAGLHALVSRSPGFALIRSPVHAWFVAALGISLLAGLGVSLLSAWLPAPALFAIPALLFADLWYWNAFPNPIAFAPTGFRERFEKREAVGRQMVAATQSALSRFHSPPNLFSFGTLNHPLELKFEATYGYNPLELRGYAAYMTALDSNPKLLAGLKREPLPGPATGRRLRVCWAAAACIFSEVAATHARCCRTSPYTPLIGSGACRGGGTRRARHRCRCDSAGVDRRSRGRLVSPALPGVLAEHPTRRDPVLSRLARDDRRAGFGCHHGRRRIPGHRGAAWGRRDPAAIPVDVLLAGCRDQRARPRDRGGGNDLRTPDDPSPRIRAARRGRRRPRRRGPVVAPSRRQTSPNTVSSQSCVVTPF